jgi:hypothetical protein
MSKQRDNTPRTLRLDSYDKKKNYLENHLFNDFRWMFCAATEWWIQEEFKRGVIKDGIEIGHHDVYTMDSAFLHARALFEFFTKRRNDYHCSCEEFIAKELQCKRYANWADPLHKHVMHFQTRDDPKQLGGFSDGMKALNKMPVDFALEVRKLWKEFEKELSKTGNVGDKELRALARERRQKVITEACCIVSAFDGLQTYERALTLLLSSRRVSDKCSTS